MRREGNPASQKLIEDVFEVCDRKWRGVGVIPPSGYRLRHEYRDHDAEQSSRWTVIETQESTVCISGQILQGLKKPHECPAFGNECTPQTPLGATMVSAEGACAAYHAYGRHLESVGVRRLVSGRRVDRSHGMSLWKRRGTSGVFGELSRAAVAVRSNPARPRQRRSADQPT